MKFSIIIVTFNRRKSLMDCLQSINTQIFNTPFEVIVILNGDISYREKYKSTFPNFNFIHIPQTTNADARNIAIQKAIGEYIFFLEDDCILPNNYFTQIDFNNNWDVLSGPDQTPLHASAAQTLIGRALASPFCMGPAFKRHSRQSRYNNHASEDSLVICNLWFKAQLFKKNGFSFDRALFKNEEFYLLKRMAEKNVLFHYDPNLFVYHLRPASLERLGAALIQSGKFRTITFFSTPKKNELIYFLPLLFSVFFFGMIFHPNIWFLLAIGLFTIAVLVFGIITHRRLSLRFVLLHYYILFCYNIGLLKGVWPALLKIYIHIKNGKWPAFTR
ncbi:MAG: glycosyltransferase [Bacteriovorax sp.]|nr:glycosyltransferase [Bacteriovorax sp.]